MSASAALCPKDNPMARKSEDSQNNPIMHLHADGVHFIMDGEDRGVLSDTCVSMIQTHRRTLAANLAALRAADHLGPDVPEEQTLIEDTDRAEILDALRLARYHISAATTWERCAIDVHASNAPSELLREVLDIPKGLILTMAEATLADPERALPSYYPNAERPLSDLDALTGLVERHNAADARINNHSGDAEADMVTELMAASGAIMAHKCATAAEATALLVFAASSREFQVELSDSEGFAEQFVKNLYHFASPASSEGSTFGHAPAGEAARLIAAHKAAFERKSSVADALASAGVIGGGPDYDAAARDEDVASVELAAGLWELGPEGITTINDYLANDPACGIGGTVAAVTELPKEMVFALRDHYRANAATGQ